MLRLKKVAVTGGLSCGKSSVCHIFKRLGAYVISTDKIVHQLLSFNTKIGQEVVSLLGTDVLVNKKIDRSQVAKIVFENIKLLHALEAIIHPAVYEDLNRQYQQQKNSLHPPPLFVAEIPLLFESEAEENFDVIIVVTAEKNVCLKRFKEKTKYPLKEFDKRAARQLPLLEKASKANYIIVNNGSLKNLKQVTSKLYQELTKRDPSQIE